MTFYLERQTRRPSGIARTSSAVRVCIGHGWHGGARAAWDGCGLRWRHRPPGSAVANRGGRRRWGGGVSGTICFPTVCLVATPRLLGRAPDGGWDDKETLTIPRRRFARRPSGLEESPAHRWQNPFEATLGRWRDRQRTHFASRNGRHPWGAGPDIGPLACYLIRDNQPFALCDGPLFFLFPPRDKKLREFVQVLSRYRSCLRCRWCLPEKPPSSNSRPSFPQPDTRASP